MKSREYQIMYEIEDHFWWFLSLRKLYRFLLRRFSRDLTILDAGCGTGADSLMLSKYGSVVSLDLSPEALHYCKQRGLSHLIQGDINALPFKDEQFDLVLASDVIYHQWVNDSQALTELHRVLKKGGTLILNTASYNFMKSSHDEAVMTKTRYTKKQLQTLLERNHFNIKNIFYWNSLLFPLLFVMRLININPGEHSDLHHINPLVNKTLLFILNIEIALIRLGIPFPFGLSIMVKAQKI